MRQPEFKLILCFSVIFIFFLGMIGCATFNQEKIKKALDSWLGSHKSGLIQSWGPPTRYESDGKGGEILVYEKARTVGMFYYGSYIQRTFIDYTDMFCDSNGIIYYWRNGTR